MAIDDSRNEEQQKLNGHREHRNPKRRLKPPEAEAEIVGMDSVSGCHVFDRTYSSTAAETTVEYLKWFSAFNLRDSETVSCRMQRLVRPILSYSEYGKD